MRALVILIAIAAFGSNAGAQRDSIEVGAFGGGLDVGDAYGTATYVTAGVTARYRRWSPGGVVGASLSSSVGRRVALDQPAYIEFGSVANRFGTVYAGLVGGTISENVSLIGTIGPAFGVARGTGRARGVIGAVSLALRAGPLRYLALTTQIGSTDAWITDRTMLSAGVAHADPKFRIAARVVGGFAYGPRLSSVAGDESLALVRRRGIELVVPVLDLMFEVQLGVTIARDHDLDIGAWFGRQQPLVRLTYRSHFAWAIGRTRPTRRRSAHPLGARPGPEGPCEYEHCRRPSAWQPPASMSDRARIRPPTGASRALP